MSNKRLTILNRKTKPVFEQVGAINVDLLLPYTSNIIGWTLEDTLNLRDKNNVSYKEDKLKFYNHCTIQMPNNKLPSPDAVDYVVPKQEYEELVNIVQDEIGDTFRMRWAKLEARQTLDWHIDPPTGDRFIIVVKGEHTVEIQTKADTHSQSMLPGEVWYINSNWYHRVINNTNIDRYAVLGCFNYGI